MASLDVFKGRKTATEMPRRSHTAASEHVVPITRDWIGPDPLYGPGNLHGYWSVRVTGNWRIVFRFENGEALDVDLDDYH